MTQGYKTSPNSQESHQQPPPTMSQVSPPCVRNDLRSLAYDLSAEMSAHNTTRIKLQNANNKLLQYEESLTQERDQATALRGATRQLQEQIILATNRRVEVEMQLNKFLHTQKEKAPELPELKIKTTFLDELPGYSDQSQNVGVPANPAIAPERSMRGSKKRPRDENGGSGSVKRVKREETETNKAM